MRVIFLVMVLLSTSITLIADVNFYGEPVGESETRLGCSATCVSIDQDMKAIEFVGSIQMQGERSVFETFEQMKIECIKILLS